MSEWDDAISRWQDRPVPRDVHPASPRLVLLTNPDSDSSDARRFLTVLAAVTVCSAAGWVALGWVIWRAVR